MSKKLFAFIVFLLVYSGSLTCSAQNIYTYAGSVGSGGASGDGGTATAAAVGNPNGVAVDRYGNVYISDAANNVVRKINAATGVITTVAGNGTTGYSGDGAAATAASLNYPQGLCVDTSGNIYIADEANFVIRKVNVSGIITTIAGSAGSGGSASYSGDGGAATAATLSGAVDVAIDRNGNLYIADGYTAIRKINASGIISTFAGSGYFGTSGDGGPATAATFYNPTGVDVDTFGNVYISDNQNNAIRKVNTSGIISLVAGDYFGAGTGSGFGGSGAYAGDGGPATTGELNNPYGLCVSPGGDIYIADQYNNVVRFVSAATGIISTYAGNTSGAAGYSGDGGAATAATLNANVDVAIDASGKLYIADYGNNVVRKVVPSANLTVYTASDTVCAGTPVLFTSSITYSGTVHYHWVKNGSVVGSDSTMYYADSLHDADSVFCIATGAAITDTLGVSNRIRITVLPSVTPTIVITASTSDTVCVGTSVTYTASVTGSGATPSIVWNLNGTDTVTTTTFTLVPNNGDVIRCRMTSSYRCISVSPVYSNVITMTVNPVVTPAIAISTASDTICTGTSARFTASISGGGIAPHYHWYSGTTTIGSDTSSITYTPTSGAVISCVLTSNALCRSRDTAHSNTITMIVATVVTPTISIAVSGGDTSCVGVPDTIYATTTHGGSAPVYTWTVGGYYVGSGNPLIYTPSAWDVVQCFLTSSECTATSTPVASNTRTLSVFSPSTPSVTISSTADTVCAGSSVTFTATGYNTGTSPVYRWEKNGVAVSGGTSYTYMPTSGDTITCVLTSNAHCRTIDSAISTPVIMVVYAIVTPTLAISVAPGDTVCASTVVTYTAAITGGGSAPAITWMVNGSVVSSSTTYAYTPVNGDTVSCRMVSNYYCTTVATVTATPVIMTVNPVVTPSISISTGVGDTVCTGTVTCTPTVVNGGSSPAYRWYKNGVLAATSTTYTYTPASGDSISCVVYSSNSCAIPDSAVSNTIRLTVVSSIVPAITIAAAPDSIVCTATSVTFTAHGSGGGSASAYQWRVNGVNTGTAGTYTYTPVNGDIVTCKFTSNAACRTVDSVNSRPIRMTVLPFVSPSVTIVSAPGDTVCVASTISFTPSPVFGGAGPTYNWFVNGAAVGTSATYSYTPATGDLVKCVLHSNYGCLTVDTAISNTITVTVLTSVTPAVSIRASRDTVCAGTAVTFTPTATFGGTSPVYRWYVNGSFVATGATYSYLPAAGDVVKCIMYSAMTCATPDSAISNTKTIVVRSGIVPSITITAVPGTTVTYGTTVTFNSVVVNGGTAPTYQWQVNGTNIAGATNSTYVTDSLQHNDVVTCIVTSNDPCASPVTATSNSTTITISNVGVAEVNFANASFTISPNPNTGTFQLLGQVNDVITTLDISVTDMAGKVVYRKQVGVAKGRITELLQPEADLASGMYLLHLNYAGGNTVLHFEIVK